MCNFQKGALLPKSTLTHLFSKEKIDLAGTPFHFTGPDILEDEYREFLAGQGISSREEMKNRNKAKNVRKTVRRLLWQLKNKSKQ